MDKDGAREQLHALFKVALGFVKTALGFILISVGVALIIYMVRFPFYEDSLEEFIKPAMTFSSIVLGMTFIYAAGYWLFQKSLVFKLMLGGVIVLAVFASCSGESTCVESRYISC